MLEPPPLSHYQDVAQFIYEGRLIPFFGAGVNRCQRPSDVSWMPGRYLPDGNELAQYLVDEFDSVRSTFAQQKRCPECKATPSLDLLRVSQYIYFTLGSSPLYERLRKVFDNDYPFTSVHAFFAKLPRLLRDAGRSDCNLLLVTTNYDDLLEEAFKSVGEEFDLVTYIADANKEKDEDRGKFLHWKPDGSVGVIEEPNNYSDLSLKKRSIILKIHGAVDRQAPKEADDERKDSYVITEDHYIDYLTRTDLSYLLPATLGAALKKKHILFLGYSLRDWNLRAIFRRIWTERRLTYNSWAIQMTHEKVDERYWEQRGQVDIFDRPLDAYIADLSEQFQLLLKSKKHPS